MRLLEWNDRNTPSFTEDLPTDDVPPYAILSHTWGSDSDEVTFADLQDGRASNKAVGYAKIRFCGEQARRDEIKYFWVDTCCINKADHNELSEAITSMFRWYKNAKKCYVYLSDVSMSKRNIQDVCPWEASFRTSRWFTRGWTLQELLAPQVVEFFSRDEKLLGDKVTLMQQIHEITTIPVEALEGKPLTQFSIAEKIRWTEKRKTKKKEDEAYCLLGIFNVFMPLIYGEGDNAFRRLIKEINEQFGSTVAVRLGEVDTSNVVDTRNTSLGLCWGSAPLIDQDDFIGRTTELDQMARVLKPGQSTVEQRRLVLGGLGGMGKTQLAIAYARRYHDSYTSVFWLNATSEPTLKAGFRSVAQLLLTASEFRNLDEDESVKAVGRWLSDKRTTQWLLILDNYDNPNLYSIEEYLPIATNGAVIITTRVPDRLKGRRMPTVRVTAISDLDEGIMILQTRSQRKDIRRDTGARDLAQRLKGLPLALATAGAYLRKTTMTCRQYLEAYEKRFDISPRRPLLLPEYQDRTLYTTWDLSYRLLEHEEELAAKMLKLLAYFDNQEITYQLLHAGLNDDSAKWLREAATDRVDFENVMGTLVDYCLVEAQPIRHSYSMHNCVHDWTLAQLNKVIDQEQYEYAVECVVANIDDRSWESLKKLRYAGLARHALRLVHPRFTQEVLFNIMPLDRLHQLNQLAKLLSQQVLFFSAEAVYQRVLAGYEKELGLDHTSTLDTVNNLGVLYSDQGKLDEAERMYQRALAGCEKALGPDHTSTLGTIDNLGVLYYSQGKLDKAEKFFARCRKDKT